MRTEPSGKIARISNWPPMASMNLESVPIYMSVRRSILETFDCLMRSNLARCSCVSSRAARSWSRLIFSRVSFTRAATLSRASGVIFASSSLKFLAIVLFLQICKVLIVQSIDDRDEDLVPALFASLVAADQQNAARFGSNAYSKRYGRPWCCIRSSRICSCLLVEMPEQRGKRRLTPSTGECSRRGPRFPALRLLDRPTKLRIRLYRAPQPLINYTL